MINWVDTGGRLHNVPAEIGGGGGGGRRGDLRKSPTSPVQGDNLLVTVPKSLPGELVHLMDVWDPGCYLLALHWYLERARR